MSDNKYARVASQRRVGKTMDSQLIRYQSAARAPLRIPVYLGLMCGTGTHPKSMLKVLVHNLTTLNLE